MNWEYSCGAVVFTRENGHILFTIVQEQSGAYSFPKGHMESNETEMETARREILEETGLNPDFLPGFKAEDEYDLAEKPGTRKRVTYFLAEYKNQPLVPRQGEIRRIELLPFDEALSCFEHEGTKSVLTKAQTFLTEQSENGRWQGISEVNQTNSGLQGRMKMGTKSVVVLPYDEQWEQAFAYIKGEIYEALGSLALRIEHVGSTSVRGLSAKPIIDIDVVIKDYSVFDAVVAALEEIGYHHEGDLGIAAREAFKYDGKEHLQKHHLYVCPQDSAELKRHVAFRNYLRSDPEAVRKYSRIKEEGAALYPNDIEKYIQHKSPFIEKIYREIGV